MKIFIIATAARSSGALTILKQFIEHLSSKKDENQYYIFISPSISLCQIPNVVYIPIDTISWMKRILWDEYGFSQWIKKNRIKPDLVISFQNTGTKYKKVPTLLYYHQPLPLIKYKWNIFKKDERLLFFYTNFYSLFVKRYLHSNVSVIVQTPSIRTAFINRFNIEESRVYLLRPDIKNNKSDIEVELPFKTNLIQFIYPATFLPYKNHILIVKSLHYLQTISPEILPFIRVYFTISESKHINLAKEIRKYNLQNNFVFKGIMSSEMLHAYYTQLDALLFPSFIETFGLPLIEASAKGLPIIAADMPYAHDVIGEYEGVKFVGYDDYIAWANEIQNICKMKQVNHEAKRYTALMPKEYSDWDMFFELINQLKE
jgi:glycosyltransferase involved in cell wall biosynthesis